MINEEVVRQLIRDNLDSRDSERLLLAVDSIFKDGDLPIVPDQGSGSRTWGDWSVYLPYTKEEVRPTSNLNLETIDMMLRCGAIHFALKMKQGRLVSAFRNERSIKIHTTDPELEKITSYFVNQVLPFSVWELSWSALVYGTAFMETGWEIKSGYQLGMTDEAKHKVFSVPTIPNLVPWRTVRAIKRSRTGQFEGFIQNISQPHYRWNPPAQMALVNSNDIEVPADSALVVPYDGYSRNLWGRMFLEPLMPLWFWYEIIMRCLVRFSELMGDPPRLASAPLKKMITIKSTGQTVEALDYMLTVGKNLSNGAVVAIPSDLDPDTKQPQFSLSFMQTPDRSQPFVQILELFHKMIQRAALTGDGVSGMDVGKVTGESSSETTSLNDEMIVTQWTRYINEMWVSRISTYNRGKNGPPVWLETQSLNPRERDYLNSVLNIAGNSSTVQEFFDKVDWTSLGQIAGLPMLSREQLEEAKARSEQEQLKQQAQTEVQQQQQAQQQQEFAIEQAKAKQQQLQIANADFIALSDYEAGALGLENPYHDEKGRFTFADRLKTGMTATKQFVKENKGELIAAGLVVGAAVAGTTTAAHLSKTSKSKAAQRQIDLLNQEMYTKRWQEQTPTTQRWLATPAEYMARKRGLGPKVARMAAMSGPDVAFSMLAYSGIYAKGSLLGAAATAAIGTAVFGGISPALVTLGGIAIGTGAAVIASEVVDNLGEKFVHGYINRYAPKDDYHLTFTQSKVKKGLRYLRWANYLTSGLPSFGVEMAANFFFTPTMETEDASDFARLIYPVACTLAIDDRLRSIRNDFEFPGFKADGEDFVMTRDSLDEFFEAWDTGNFGIIPPPLKLERTYVRDENGRFATTPGTVGEIQNRLASQIRGVKPIPVNTASTWKEVGMALGVKNQDIIGAYHNGTIILTPKLSQANHRRVLIHETLHGRTRSRGNEVFPLRNAQSWDIEEATTELMTMRYSQGDFSKSWYANRMARMATLARQVAKNDRERAWKFVEDMHYFNDTQAPVVALKHHTGNKNYLRIKTNDFSDVDWLMQNQPRYLESVEEENLEHSEKAVSILRMEKTEFQDEEPIQLPFELLNEGQNDTTF